MQPKLVIIILGLFALVVYVGRKSSNAWNKTVTNVGTGKVNSIRADARYEDLSRFRLIHAIK